MSGLPFHFSQLADRRGWFYQERAYLWSDYLHDLGLFTDFLEVVRRNQLAGIASISDYLVIFGDVVDMPLFFQKGDVRRAIIGGVA